MSTVVRVYHTPPAFYLCSMAEFPCDLLRYFSYVLRKVELPYFRENWECLYSTRQCLFWICWSFVLSRRNKESICAQYWSEIVFAETQLNEIFLIGIAESFLLFPQRALVPENLLRRQSCYMMEEAAVSSIVREVLVLWYQLLQRATPKMPILHIFV